MKYLFSLKANRKNINAEILTSEDVDIDTEIQKRKHDLAILESIVGESPMKQIDWIIENSLSKYNYWLTCYERGTINDVIKVKKEYKKHIETTNSTGIKDALIDFSDGDMVLRGGKGNRVISVFRKIQIN
jgi:hypothetical protein